MRFKACSILDCLESRNNSKICAGSLRGFLGHRCMSDRRYTGRAVIVTGASRGIGRAIAMHLAGEDALLVLNACNEEGSLREVAEACTTAGGSALILDGDLADPAVAASLVALALQHYGK